MIPEEHNMACIASENLIPNSPVTMEHLNHKFQIYGPDADGIKGKTAKRSVSEVSVDLEVVLLLILIMYRNLTFGAYRIPGMSSKTYTHMRTGERATFDDPKAKSQRSKEDTFI